MRTSLPKALLIDLNGTLHIGSELTPRAEAAVSRLRDARIPFVFCSNSTKESEARLVAKLNAMGLQCTPREVVTSLGACRALVDRRSLRPYLLLSPDAAEEFAPLPAPPYDAVVLGLHAPAFTYERLNTAFRILKGEPLADSDSSSTPGAAHTKKPVLIAPHTAAYHQAPASDAFPAGLSLGIGAYVAALEAASGVTPEIVGKPTPSFYRLAIARAEEVYGVGLEAAQIAIVGDDVRNDLGYGAVELGLRRILVRTGKYRPGVEDGMDHPPDDVFDSFADFVDALLDG